MAREITGTKYAATKDMDRAAIAKLIREDIKAAVKAGTLPKGKYSVRTETYSGGGSINMRISDLKVIAFSDAAHEDSTCYRTTELYHDELKAVLAKLVEIHGAYNYDYSDSMSDYFHVRYYGTPDWSDFDHTWLEAKREWEKAAHDDLRAARAHAKASTRELFLAFAGVEV